MIERLSKRWKVKLDQLNHLPFSPSLFSGLGVICNCYGIGLLAPRCWLLFRGVLLLLVVVYRGVCRWCVRGVSVPTPFSPGVLGGSFTYLSHWSNDRMQVESVVHCLQSVCTGYTHLPAQRVLCVSSCQQACSFTLCTPSSACTACLLKARLVQSMDFVCISSCWVAGCHGMKRISK